ncbi:hypothetical protein [Planctomicrobium piriforme]|uniref:DNA (Cytosine-5)-methyltransferase 1 n=1 Tax=Planctomicrobium piriforme TaxID=1576369 RepID=A0A1I3EGQ9_9PLAN|nr:hypothetical protein [Planctomicrobium piriforme]SFH98174.1 hypothetical protein SAMN05421753_104216 [Planctomicrobium piriforme]
MNGIIVSLFDYTGNMVRPWADAGFQCYCVDIQHSIRRDRSDGNIHFVWGDARSWLPPDRPLILFAFPPCTHLAVSGARDFAKKSWPMLRDGMDCFHAAYTAANWAGCPFMIENPVGRISGIHGKPNSIFDPCDYGGYLDPPGDEYTKSTCLWTGGGVRYARAASSSAGTGELDAPDAANE